MEWWKGWRGEGGGRDGGKRWRQEDETDPDGGVEIPGQPPSRPPEPAHNRCPFSPTGHVQASRAGWGNPIRGGGGLPFSPAIDVEGQQHRRDEKLEDLHRRRF